MNRIPVTIRYGTVSGLCLLLGVVLITLFSSIGFHYSVATVAAFCIISLVGFSLHCHWTFRVEKSLSSFLCYISAMLINLPLTIMFIGIWHDLAGLSILVSTMLASAILFIWNYVAAKWAITGKSLGGQ